jgi:ribosomal protein L34
LDRSSVAEAFKSQSGLHAFLNAAFGPSSDREDETWPKFGVGRGGRPWAHRSFGWKNILPKSNVDEGFFWRADTRGGKAILSLRKYWDHGNLDKRKELAARRFQVYLKAVESTFKALNTGFVPSKLAARRSSYKEQELLLFTLGDSRELECANDPVPTATAIAIVATKSKFSKLARVTVSTIMQTLRSSITA